MKRFACYFAVVFFKKRKTTPADMESFLVCAVAVSLLDGLRVMAREP